MVIILMKTEGTGFADILLRRGVRRWGRKGRVILRFWPEDWKNSIAIYRLETLWRKQVQSIERTRNLVLDVSNFEIHKNLEIFIK